MDIRILPTVGEIAEEIIKMLEGVIAEKKDALLCLAAGHTSLPVFSRMTAAKEEGRIDFSRCRFVGLDEWGGLGCGDDGSMIDFMYKNLFEPLGTEENRIIFFDGKADLLAECGRIDAYVRASGGIDFMLLGMGMNGHLGLNEPGTSFELNSHVVLLDSTTKAVARKYFSERPALRDGITLGMKDIGEAKRVALVVTGTEKREIAAGFLKTPITPKFPATFLKSLIGCSVFFDKAAGENIEKYLSGEYPYSAV